MARATSALIAVLLLAACAGMSEAECRSADWYALGYRDARYRIQKQDVVYGPQCERYGVKIDAPRYIEGWRHGTWDFPDLTP